MRKYKCNVCGETYYAVDSDKTACPRCGVIGGGASLVADEGITSDYIPISTQGIRPELFTEFSSKGESVKPPEMPKGDKA